MLGIHVLHVLLRTSVEIVIERYYLLTYCPLLAGSIVVCAVFAVSMRRGNRAALVGRA